MKNQQERARTANALIHFSFSPLYPVAFPGGKVIHIKDAAQAKSQPNDDNGKREVEPVRKKRRSINRLENDGLDHLL